MKQILHLILCLQNTEASIFNVHNIVCYMSTKKQNFTQNSSKNKTHRSTHSMSILFCYQLVDRIRLLYNNNERCE